jgi:hypothetical protein
VVLCMCILCTRALHTFIDPQVDHSKTCTKCIIVLIHLPPCTQICKTKKEEGNNSGVNLHKNLGLLSVQMVLHQFKLTLSLNKLKLYAEDAPDTKLNHSTKYILYFIHKSIKYKSHKKVQHLRNCTSYMKTMTSWRVHSIKWSLIPLSPGETISKRGK